MTRTLYRAGRFAPRDPKVVPVEVGDGDCLHGLHDTPEGCVDEISASITAELRHYRFLQRVVGQKVAELELQLSGWNNAPLQAQKDGSFAPAQQPEVLPPG